VQQLKIFDSIDKSLLLPKLKMTDTNSMSGGENGGEIADDTQSNEQKQIEAPPTNDEAIKI
jgi:hypothetical protein